MAVYGTVFFDLGNLPCSNSSVEGWHNGFSSRVTVVHPNIKKLTEKIRQEQSKFEVDIAQLLQGLQPKPKTAAYRIFDERLARVVCQYNPLHIHQYLKNIAGNISL